MISVCMIVKDEEKYIEECLKNIKSKTDYEIVVVDTGSSDRTKEIAKKYTDKVYDFEWCDDFSKARNFSASKASNDYILAVDADEYLTQINKKKIKKLIINSPSSVGMSLVKSILGDDEIINTRINRLYNRKIYHFEGAVHEQITRKDSSTDYDVYNLPISFNHMGYNLSKEELKIKGERNIKILLKELEKNPNAPYILYQLGKGYSMADDVEEACKYYKKAFDMDLDPSHEYVRDLVEKYGYTLIDLGKKELALGLEKVYDKFSYTADFIFLMGYIYTQNQMFDKAMEEFKKATKFSTSKREGLNSYLSYYNLGVINEIIGNIEDSLKYYKKCGNYSKALERINVLEKNNKKLDMNKFEEKMISACLIAKDEEKHIEKCLKALKTKTNFEIVVVDTGSSDRTKEIAKKYTDKVYDFEWCDDFSKARNFSISKAANDYVLIVDADEFLEKINKKELISLIKKYPEAVGRSEIISVYTDNEEKTANFVRISRFFNRKYYHYKGIIHEQVTRLDGVDGYNAYDMPLSFNHAGYSGTDEECKKKGERNNRLLKKQLELTPDDPYIYYQIGKGYYIQGEYNKAADYFTEALKFNLDPKLEYVQNLVETYGYALLNIGEKEFALSLESVYDEFATGPDFIFLMGYIYMSNGKFDKAVEEFQKATKYKKAKMEGVNSYLANYNTGVIYEVLQNYEKAEYYYKKSGDYPKAKQRLVQINNKK